MALKYRLKPLCDNITSAVNDGAVPLVVKGKTISLRAVAKQIAAQSSFSAGDALGVLQNLAEVVPMFLGQGMNVNIENFGTFGIAVALKDKKKPAEKITGRDVYVKRVTFKSSPNLRTLMSEVTFECE